MRASPILLAGLLACWAAGRAEARPKDPRESTARKECLAGHVEAGIGILADLFAETENPNFIYNQGRCFEQNSRHGEAIARFREYLRVDKNTTEADKADVERHMAECLAAEASEAAAKGGASPAERSRGVPAQTGSETLDASMPPAPPPAGAPSPSAGTSLTPPLLPAAGRPDGTTSHPARDAVTGPLTAGPDEAPRPGAGLRATGLVVACVGVGALVSGIVFGVLSKDVEGDVNSSAATGKYSRSKDETGQTYQTLQWVGYGTGALLVAGGGLLYYLGLRAGRAGAGPSVAIVPDVGPAQVGATLQGTF